MKIGFVVNDLGTEEHVYTTVRLALAATAGGHEASPSGRFCARSAAPGSRTLWADWPVTQRPSPRDSQRSRTQRC